VNPPAPGAGPALRPFSLAAWQGEITAALPAARLAAEVARLTDPGQAVRTLHWGRNFLYLVHLLLPAGELPAVVKQFRHDSRRSRLDRRWRGSRAARSLRAALAVQAAGVSTPEPLALVESRAPAGPAFFVCRHEPEGFEARYFFRALAAGRAGEEYPGVRAEALAEAVAALARRLHEAGIWHRDLSIGNLLIRPGATPETPPALVLLDLDRCRIGVRMTTSRRTRDLCRLPFREPAHQERLLAAYWGRTGNDLRFVRALYRLYQRSFLLRHRWKPALRAAGRKLRGLLFSRTTHPHIPPPPPGAAVADRIVWDPLSDQPHLHAGRAGRARVRLRALPEHTAALAAATAGLLRARSRYRQLRGGLFATPVRCGEVAVALRPVAGDPEPLLAAVRALGVRHALLRLHPWQERHDAEAALAAGLRAQGIAVAFALPQSRELVRDPGRWRAAVEEIAARFTPYGHRFQVGQAINRSKWGVWRPREYLRLAAAAAAILRRTPGVEIAGPAVIDFEPHALAAALCLDPGAEPRFDLVSALLYVDRRGAPENRQLGFDTLGKLALYRALAATSPRGADRLWVSEVNWPLAEGPHSPAGRAVAVGEQAQADYLSRYLLLALGSGLAERVDWWQLVARGYGLIDPLPDGTLRRRPAFAALAHLARLLAGATCEGREPAPPPAWLLRLTLGDGGRAWAGWSAGAPVEVALPARPARVLDRDGEELPPPDGVRVRLDGSPRFFLSPPERGGGEP